MTKPKLIESNPSKVKELLIQTGEISNIYCAGNIELDEVGKKYSILNCQLDEISIKGSIAFSSSVTIQNSSIKSLKLEKSICNITWAKDFEEMKIEQISIEENELIVKGVGSNIQHIDAIKCINTKVQVKNISIGQLDITNGGLKNVINSRIDHLKLRNLNLGGVKLDRVTIGKSIISKNVRWTDSIIINTNFSNSLLVFDDGSSIDGIQSRFTLWPTRYNQYLDDEYNTAQRVHQNFMILKKMAQDNWDHVFEKKVKALELQAHYESLLEGKSRSQRFRTRVHRIDLAFSKWSNDFGRSFWRPIFWFFLFSILFYILVRFFGINDISFQANYWSFLIPTHKISDMALDSCGRFYDIAVALDFFWRVFSGMLIFQLIRAFRFYSIK